MIFRILLYAFIAYVLYKIIFHLIIPVYKTTRQFKKGFQEMQDHMKDQQQQSTSPNKAKSSSQKPVDDYIDFEEIK